MKDGDSEVTITESNGKELEDEEARAFLAQLQGGVTYIPQNR